MKKDVGHIIAIVMALVSCVTLVLSGCAKPKHEGFAIYLTKADIPPTEMQVLSQVKLAEEPIITVADIITYNAQTHELKLTENAFERIRQLEVPVRGRSFVVCVDKKPVYWGAFWKPISSISFDGVTIWKPLSGQGAKVITLELGYPSPTFYGGKDPRNDPKVIQSLGQAGKLINKLSITAVTELPRSMKGYELYSWSANGQWHFTLITGTNRNKTLDEIVTGEDIISESGWVVIHGVNLEAIKTVLSKLPQNGQVSWLAGLGSEPILQNFIIALPPQAIIDTLKECATEFSINLVVARR